VQQDLGHASLTTTSRYEHAHPADGSARYLSAGENRYPFNSSKTATNPESTWRMVRVLVRLLQVRLTGLLMRIASQHYSHSREINVGKSLSFPQCMPSIDQTLPKVSPCAGW